MTDPIFLLGKLLFRHGWRPPTGVKPWSLKYLRRVRQEVHFEPPAQETTWRDYLHDVEHAEARMARQHAMFLLTAPPPLCDTWARGTLFLAAIQQWKMDWPDGHPPIAA